MLPLLGYILDHLRTLQISLIGFFVIYFILERTAGLRYGRTFSLFLWSLVWMYRYFGVSLYVSTYLARDHMGELWFEEFLLLLMLINIGIGISAIALVFKGNLQKNLIVEMIFEITYSLAYFMGMMVVYSGNSIEEQNLLASYDPRDLILGGGILILCLLTTKYAGPPVLRFLTWEPRYPLILTVVLFLYYFFGYVNNLNFAVSRGASGLLLFFPQFFILIAYLWMTLFHEEMVKAMRSKDDLIRSESALKSHYEQALVQNAKLNHYNREISKAINALMEKALGADLNPDPAGGREAEGDSPGGSLVKERMNHLVADYLAGLEDHYRELSLFKYSEDAGINNLLISCEERFRQRNIPIQISFHDFHLTSEVGINDIEKLLTGFCDKALKNYHVDGSDRYQGDDHQKDPLKDPTGTLLQGGISGREMILSCQYPGRMLSGKERREIRSLCRRLQADVSMEEYKGLVKMIAGISM